ncbi:hypothetical protein ACFWQG_13195 [Rhodococcus sp. NPDC058532]
MIPWDCPDCGTIRNAPCGPVCLPAARIDLREFKAARLATERAELEL